MQLHDHDQMGIIAFKEQGADLFTFHQTAAKSSQKGQICRLQIHTLLSADDEIYKFVGNRFYIILENSYCLLQLLDSDYPHQDAGSCCPRINFQIKSCCYHHPQKGGPSELFLWGSSWVDPAMVSTTKEESDGLCLK